jgi:hypothetical protein
MKFKTILLTSLLGVMLTAFAVLVHRSYAIEPVNEPTGVSEAATVPAIYQPELDPANLDTDMDGLTDTDEVQKYHTNPTMSDTDGDGYNDAMEVNNGYSPLVLKLKLNQIDTDKDGLNDDAEIKLGTSLAIADTNGDGQNDLEDIQLGLSPTSDKTLAINKRIEVDIKTFGLKYFFNDVVIGSSLVSTGRKGMPTPVGEFTVLDKVPSKVYGGGKYTFFYPNTKWNLHFATGSNKLRYYIHGAYWHDLFGKKNVSSGCVNVAYKDMEPLYKFASVGTKIIIK